MNSQYSWFGTVAKAVAIATGALMLTTSGYAATDNAQERRDARDVKQDSRQGAREAKVDCRKADEKSNSECRQEKRSTKQTGRQDSRDVRAGNTPKP